MKTGGHIKPCKVGQVEEHNRRDPAYVERMASSKHPLHFYPHLACRENVDVFDSKYSDKYNSVKDIFDAMIGRYQEMDKRHRKPPLKDREKIDKKTGKKVVVSGWSPIREMVVVIKKDTTIDELKKFSDWLKAEKGVNTIFTSLHFDEGHIGKKDKKFHCNFHVHLGLDFFNWETGKTIKLDKKDMSDIQTALAECLGMERGEIKDISEKEHLDVVDFRLKAEEDALLEEHQERIERSERKVQESEKEVERMEKMKAELAQQVGTGAKIAAFFKVGEYAEIRTSLEKAISAMNEALNGKTAAVYAMKAAQAAEVAAKKALREAEAAAAKELATEKEKSRQKGISDANKVQQLEDEVQQLKRQLSKDSTLEHLNQVLKRFDLQTVTGEELKKISYLKPVPYWKHSRTELCHSIIEWGKQREEVRFHNSPKALQRLRELFEEMKKMFDEVKEGLVNFFRAESVASVEYIMKHKGFTWTDLFRDVVREVAAQLRFTPGVADLVMGWEKALDMKTEDFMAQFPKPLQSQVLQENKEQHIEQHVQEEEVEEVEEEMEEEVRRGFRR